MNKTKARGEAGEPLIFEKAANELLELFPGLHPIEALERLVEIENAHEKLQGTLAQNAPAPKEQKRGLKI